MLAGETSVASDGYENALFPLDYVNCTQVSGPNSYSHCCGHPCDWIGPNDIYPYYAPFSMTQIAYISSEGTTRWCSDRPVHTPLGLRYVTVQFTHDNTAPIGVAHLNQGDLVGHTGTAGFVTGDHVHIDQSDVQNDPLVSYGIYCQGGNLCYALQNSKYPYQIFYMTGNETIVNTQGMTFQTVPATPANPISWPVKILLMKYNKMRKEKNKNGKRFTGTL